MSQQIKFSTTVSQQNLNDPSEVYVVMGSSKVDKLYIQPDVSVQSIDLGKGKDEIHLPYELSEYNSIVAKGKVLSLTTFDNTSIKISIASGQTDILYFLDGSVSVTFSSNLIKFGNVKLQSNKSLTGQDLLNNKSLKIDRQHVSEALTFEDSLVPTIEISKGNLIVSKDEGNTGTSTKFSFDVTRSGSDLSQQSIVKYELNNAKSDDGIDPSDFKGNTSGYLTFNPNETSKSIVLYVKGDDVFESDEKFIVSLTSEDDTNVQLGKNIQATGIILNDDIDQEVIDNSPNASTSNSNNSSNPIVININNSNTNTSTISNSTNIGNSSSSSNNSDDLDTKGYDAFQAGNDAVALNYFKRSADLGSAYAQMYLGYMYENGYGVSISVSDAIYWYTLAAKQNEPTAMYNLGLLYYNNSEYTNAYNWLYKSATSGNDNAQNNLGWMYQNGYGVTANLDKAIYWYTLSENNGNLTAKQNLDNLYYSYILFEKPKALELDSLVENSNVTVSSLNFKSNAMNPELQYVNTNEKNSILSNASSFDLLKNSLLS